MNKFNQTFIRIINEDIDDDISIKSKVLDYVEANPNKFTGKDLIEYVHSVGGRSYGYDQFHLHMARPSKVDPRYLVENPDKTYHVEVADEPYRTPEQQEN